MMKKVKKSLKRVVQEPVEEEEDEEEEFEEEEEVPEVEAIKKEVSAPPQPRKKIIEKPSVQEILYMAEGNLVRATDLIRLAREM